MRTRSITKSTDSTITLGHIYKNDEGQTEEVRLDHLATPTVFPRPGFLGLPPFSLICNVIWMINSSKPATPSKRHSSTC
ncbi:hypothetical protein ANCDUO_01891 [Ancylostoma duodenale]|uniref:Uncharacterized protein n=1 Tax=Ancylostoma duodenale TaxID=51022 RepID=A0A0C2HDZ4_9BILA|nr:hypothetical protein ANCDUO_01891 [Ancylostoma duodenale]